MHEVLGDALFIPTAAERAAHDFLSPLALKGRVVIRDKITADLFAVNAVVFHTRLGAGKIVSSTPDDVTVCLTPTGTVKTFSNKAIKSGQLYVVPSCNGYCRGMAVRHIQHRDGTVVAIDESIGSVWVQYKELTVKYDKSGCTSSMLAVIWEDCDFSREARESTGPAAVSLGIASDPLGPATKANPIGIDAVGVELQPVGAPPPPNVGRPGTSRNAARVEAPAAQLSAELSAEEQKVCRRHLDY